MKMKEKRGSERKENVMEIYTKRLHKHKQNIIDIIIGYNISNFDIPYLINRAKYLKLDGFMQLGRVKDDKVRIKDTSFSSKAYGKRETKEASMFVIVCLLCLFFFMFCFLLYSFLFVFFPK